MPKVPFCLTDIVLMKATAVFNQNWEWILLNFSIETLF
ncbi:hypothetical protein T07_1472 [Trichinella nelsoni]|uniref:Uncharacterized protein n=1 Tax=Trichinella nelsoni TaxID=6336 RepID=A0A0V0RCV0_9BILA|nr:hypothetical protein T07_1472 [Trichinella nelsoni]